VNTASRIQAFVGYFSQMVGIHVENRWVNLRFRLGLVDERQQVLTHYVLLKAVRKANLHLLHYGFKKAEVDAREFGLLIKRCRKHTVRYLRHCREYDPRNRRT